MPKRNGGKNRHPPFQPYWERAASFLSLAQALNMASRINEHQQLPPSVSLTLTAPLVRAFRERFPKATLCVLEGLSTYVLEWLTIGRADCAVVYTVPTSSGVELAPVLNEQLYLVSGRGAGASSTDPSNYDEVSLAEVAERNLVMPSRPHSIRMLVEATMAQASLKPRIALEIESIPAILTLVRDEGVHAILSLKAVRSSGREGDFHVRPIRKPTLETTLWIATSAQRPRGPLLNQTVPLLQSLLRDHWTIGV
ncbi:LysR substrate-binding domain-containing protein [Paraburkholderia domus]|uniref:LysR substrate-binding domain-containing protein n=1 Tax=Paraburkholderia domus TaxID=2793075 RepID=UPI001EEFF0DE|nr:LysR substrate-binding domain-containing protein [Paraburkholderia domus]